MSFIVRCLTSWSTAPSDYPPQQRYTLTIPANTVRQPFNVDIFSDTIQEPDETFLLTITSVATNGAAIGSPSRTEVTIVDTTGNVFFDHPVIYLFYSTTFRIISGVFHAHVHWSRNTFAQSGPCVKWWNI